MKKEPFKISVNDNFNFELQPEDVRDLDVVRNNEHVYHLLEDNTAFHVELLEEDYAARRYVLRIDGVKYTVAISDYYERLVQQMGLAVTGGQKMNVLKAPMPGLVLQIPVKPGQAVEKGDVLLILEAMKMENVIKAAGEGTVKSIKALQGQPVEKGQVLLEFE